MNVSFSTPIHTRIHPSSPSRSTNAPLNSSFHAAETVLNHERSTRMYVQSAFLHLFLSSLCLVEYLLQPLSSLLEEKRGVLVEGYVALVGCTFMVLAAVCAVCYAFHRWNPPKVKMSEAERTLYGFSPADNRIDTSPVISSGQTSPSNIGYRDGQRVSPAHKDLNSSYIGVTPTSVRMNSRVSPSVSAGNDSFSSAVEGDILSGGSSSLSHRNRRSNSSISAAEQSFHLSPVSLNSRGVSCDNINLSPDDTISDWRQLDAYLTSFYREEANTCLALQGQYLANSPRISRFNPKDLYQTCLPPELDPTNSQVTQDKDSTHSVLSGGTTVVDGWAKYDVTDKLSGWIEAFRKWTSATILKPLVKTVDELNTMLEQCGVTEVRLGKSNISSFAAFRPGVAPQNNPSQRYPNPDLLDRVLPFLDISPNQEYVVGRLRELARGSCIGEFVWNGGGVQPDGSPWTEIQPSDSAIVLHVFLTYIKQRLPLGFQSSGQDDKDRSCFVKKSSGNYFTRVMPNTEELKKNRNILIVQSEISPPHFVVVFKDKILQIPRGRYNLFHALLLFVYLHYKHHYGKLDTISLDSSGINISWIFKS